MKERRKLIIIALGTQLSITMGVKGNEGVLNIIFFLLFCSNIYMYSKALNSFI